MKRLHRGEEEGKEWGVPLHIFGKTNELQENREKLIEFLSYSHPSTPSNSLSLPVRGSFPKVRDRRERVVAVRSSFSPPPHSPSLSASSPPSAKT